MWTKLYIPQPRPKMVSRPRLTGLMDAGKERRLTLISASAGCGKTTLVSEWLTACPLPAAWISLEEGERDPARFLTYLCAALQTIGVDTGEGLTNMLQSAQPLPLEPVLAAILNKIAAAEHKFILVLDDYHVLNGQMDAVLGFLLDRMPSRMHLVITTREDSKLPIPRLRVRNQLTEIRTEDLRFTTSEAAEFLGRVMGLNLGEEDIALLESRTEGWIAGLQLAALSIQGQQDTAGFIREFNGSHRLVLDYLIEEVLHQQPENVQAFLLQTSILESMCAPLCDAVIGHNATGKAGDSGQSMLEYLDQANLFIVPLDNERRWYRYHHLFAGLLRTRLSRGSALPATEAELHIRASRWYENNGFILEAFQHAAAARDIASAARLAEGEGMPLIFRGAAAPVLNWLDTLSQEELEERPSLSVMHAAALLLVSQLGNVEQKLQAAEKALKGGRYRDATVAAHDRDLIGHIASIRAVLAVSRHDAEVIRAEASRALDDLNPDNLPVRTATVWALGYAYQLQGDREAAAKAYAEALSNSRRIGHVIIMIMSTLGVAQMQESDNKLHQAADTYQHVLKLAGDPPLPVACEAYLGLARISYEWNDLDASRRYTEQSIRLAGQFEQTDRVVAGEVLLSRIQLAQGEVQEAAALLDNAKRIAEQQHFVHQQPVIASVHVQLLLHQGKLETASHLAQKHGLPVSQARVSLAEGSFAEAITILELCLAQTKAKGLADEQLRVKALFARALHAGGRKPQSSHLLADALEEAMPGGFLRIFVDEGQEMGRLLRDIAVPADLQGYVNQLLTAFQTGQLNGGQERRSGMQQPKAAGGLMEPLSERELEILRLIAEGLSNREISEKLFLALSTVKGYNRNLFDKLQVKRRTEAVALARSLNLL
ncbi:LuxR C-terminal-related transcriptional regulator [Paenibacillus pinihumi]|uniref:LuxR C-terminal-related transcriptional regulator n=1 Tax=Paenibacillus pinihumi TaxID=669462 RepID=UPI0003FC7523